MQQVLAAHAQITEIILLSWAVKQLVGHALGPLHAANDRPSSILRYSMGSWRLSCPVACGGF